MIGIGAEEAERNDTGGHDHQHEASIFDDHGEGGGWRRVRIRRIVS